MTDWIQPLANWASFLYRISNEEKRADVIQSWLQKSTGWLTGLQTIFPPSAAKHTHENYLLAKTGDLEIWLIAWGEHVQTPFYTHASWMRVIHGELYEEDWKSRRISYLPTGIACYQGRPSRIHTVEPAYSVHILRAEKRDEVSISICKNSNSM